MSDHGFPPNAETTVTQPDIFPRAVAGIVAWCAYNRTKQIHAVVLRPVEDDANGREDQWCAAIVWTEGIPEGGPYVERAALDA